MADQLQLSDHAVLRMAQRAISQQELDYVRMHGDWHGEPNRRQGDRYRISLSRRLIPPEDRAEYGRLRISCAGVHRMGHGGSAGRVRPANARTPRQSCTSLCPKFRYAGTALFPRAC